MQKFIFNTFSDTAWDISPPSLKSFIKDFKATAKDKPDDALIVNFKVEWTFVRQFPIGKEKVQGKKIVQLTKADLIPVEEILARDNSNLPTVGQGNAKSVKLAQVGNDPEYDDYHGTGDYEEEPLSDDCNV